ncbi:dehydrogenase [Azospirillum sp. RWY-5-1]|uniref:2-oxoglutarate dehydrogenase E1 component n=1 Tax=Azospirillum oleiclasticum TaxID=2735135 RepID=A0ABX2TCX4_9PROT|nr:dehydrogenase E1 component subunit alpha/beta [Azospirillum oleiclasticum]NYZ15853.1 dehydrogenase [Azospirillum oleiclasticum]NYZ22123.1 dehydrogenase [Azospirillum oleiclasticum]
MLRLFETMVRIRRFEETAADLFLSGKVKGTAHSYAGQEAIAAGASLNLAAGDYIGSYHRGHGHCIAKGASTDRMMAELLGRSTGYCGGLGGSMHVADLSLNILGANGIVGATMPIGTGAALASKLRGTDAVVVAYFGDGAANQGVFHESLNLAAVWRLPMIFICENNHYALNTAFSETTSVDRIARRASSYGLSGTTIDGNDAVAVYEAVGEAVELARNGGGPSLIEAMTWRWGPHSMRDNLREPRSVEARKSWEERDPIVLMERRLTAEGEVWRDRAQEIRAAVEAEITAAVAFGMASPEPEPDILAAAVYAPHLSHAEPTGRGTRELTYTQALNEALAQEMDRDPSVFLMGEDIAETGGIFQVTKGLVERFGRDRVRDTPISEAGFCGTGVGAAIAGMRPVVEVQIFDFVTQMMDMIVNQAAKYRFMNGGVPQVPLVVRGPQGGGIRLAAQHSQSLEAWFAHVPGLVVVAPSTPFDAKGLLISAIRDNNPVIFLEHKRLYVDGQTAPVPKEAYAIPIGRGDIKRRGSDVTILATQMMVSRALAAAVQLERDGISAEIIDPRTLKPLDEEMILSSVRKTNHLVVVHEGCTGWGFGAEVAALVMEKAFDWLDAPVARVGAPDVPIPFNHKLEASVIPSTDRIVEAARAVLR